MLSQIVRLALTLLATVSPRPAFTFAVDASCSKHGDLVRSTVVDAFDLSAMALDALMASPRDPSVDRLIELLFCGPGDVPATKNVFKLEQILRGIGSMRQEVPAGHLPIAREVVFYCDLSRVEKTARSDRWFESVSHTLIYGPGGYLDDCTNRDGTLAFTYNPNMTFYDREAHSQITICPWFFDWAANKAKYVTWRDISTRAKLSRWVQPVVTWAQFSPIDAVQLFDKVIFHELTHTVAGTETNDIDLGSEGPVLFKGAAYGWKYALRLAKKGGLLQAQSGLNNADSVALFASGIRLLRRNPATYVTRDGDVTNTIQQKRAADALLSTVEDTTPADFEAFIGMLKAQHAEAGNDPYYQQI